MCVCVCVCVALSLSDSPKEEVALSSVLKELGLAEVKVELSADTVA